MTFSEFGRRAKENGSKGTDHGSAAPMFLVGGKVKAGVVGEHPSLTKLEKGNSSTRPISARCTPPCCDKWLGVDRSRCWARGSTRPGCSGRGDMGKDSGTAFQSVDDADHDHAV